MLVDPLPNGRPVADPQDWIIGDAVFRPGRHELKRAGASVAIERAAHDLLCKLIEQPGATVPKDALLAAGWPGRVVTENSLAKAISKLRAALDDREGALLQVVHGFGYRLDGERVIAPLPKPPQTSDELPIPVPTRPPVRNRRRLVLAAAASLLLLALAIAWSHRDPAGDAAKVDSGAIAVHRLLVLPFAENDAATAEDHLGRGFAAHVGESLATLPQVQLVEAPGAAVALDPVAAGRAAGASFVLAGQLRRDPPRMQVSLRLYHVATGAVGWQYAATREYRDLFVLQDELTREIATAMKVRLTPEAAAELARHPTTNPEAFERYVYARAVYADDETGGRRTLLALQEAVELDPDFYDARLFLAAHLGHNGLYADSAEEALQGKRRAMDELDRAIALRPDRPEAYIQRADFRYAHWWNWDGALEDLERGRERSSADDMLYLNRLHRLLAATGRIQEALVVGRRTQELHPQDGVAFAIQAYHLLALGRFDESERSARQALALAPLDEHAHYYLGLSQLLQGHAEVAIRHFEQSAHDLRLTGLAIARFELGDRAGSDRDLELLKSRYGHILPYQAAEVHAWRGEADAAFEWFARAHELHDASFMYLLFDPLIGRVHDDPRFAALASSVNLPNSPVRTRFPVHGEH